MYALFPALNELSSSLSYLTAHNVSFPKILSNVISFSFCAAKIIQFLIVQPKVVKFLKIIEDNSLRNIGFHRQRMKPDSIAVPEDL